MLENGIKREYKSHANEPPCSPRSQGLIFSLIIASLDSDPEMTLPDNAVNGSSRSADEKMAENSPNPLFT
jgi:hypothetical protein